MWLVVAFIVGIGMSIGDLLLPHRAPFAFNLVLVPGARDTFDVASLDGIGVTGGRVSVGDRVTAVGASWLSRVDGAAITVTDPRTGAVLQLTDLHRAALDAPSWFRHVTDVLVEAIALGLLVVRGKRTDVTWLSITLFLTVFTFPFQRGAFLGALWLATYEVIDTGLIVLGAWALLKLAIAIAPPAPWIAWAKRSVAFIALATSAYGAAYWLAYLASGFVLAGFVTLAHIAPGLILGAALWIFVASLRRAHGSERRRLAFLAFSATIGNAPIIVALFSPTIIFTTDQILLSYLGILAMTAGLAYGVLVERMFDIGFVINRAAVYAATSAFVVLAFITVEWFVEKLAAGIGHTGSSLVELALAIAIGLTLRPVHERADVIIDTVFFAARHRAANALLAFADECADSRSVEALVALTYERLAIYARPEACVIYLANDDQDLIATSESDLLGHVVPADDATAIRLRASRGVVERASFPMLRNADYAFPMTRRGGLAGAIFISLAPKAEPYSPEEVNAIAVVARSVGAAIVALEAASVQRLTAENEALRGRLAAVEAL